MQNEKQVMCVPIKIPAALVISVKEGENVNDYVKAIIDKLSEEKVMVESLYNVSKDISNTLGEDGMFIVVPKTLLPETEEDIVDGIRTFVDEVLNATEKNE